MMKKLSEMEKARNRTDKRLDNMENIIDSYYRRNSKRAIRLLEKYYSRHKDEIENKVKEYKNGEITGKEYRAFMLDKILLTKDFKKTVNRIAEVYTDINQNAIKEIVNPEMGEIYIDNYNATIKEIGGELIEDWI